jgi:DNA-binding transcriptional MocR family regulator
MLRLNFSNCLPEQIEDGIARLGRAVRHRLD